MARIDTKNLSDSLKYLLEKEAAEKNLSLNKLTKEIFEDYTKHRYSFESEKQFTNAMNHVAIAMNKNTEILEKYIENNAKLIDILTE